MRIRSHRTKTKTAPPAADAAVAAVDAALGFIAGQPWVRRQTAVAVLEAVRDAARDAGAPNACTSSSMSHSMAVTKTGPPPRR